MPHTVRIYGISGIVPLRVLNDQQAFQSSIMQLKMPYIWRQALVADAAPVMSLIAGGAPDGIPEGFKSDPTTALRIEIADGYMIRYEVNPPGRNVDADANSPILSGRDQIEFGTQWRISIRDAAGT